MEFLMVIGELWVVVCMLVFEFGIDWGDVDKVI